MTNTGQVKTFSIPRYLWRVWLAFATGLFMVAAAHATTVPNQRLAFDHLTTGYALVGQHVFVSCEACHVGGVFKGTPKQCTGCHNGVIASGKSANHIPTTAQCDLCHNVAVSFAISARMNHAGINGSCGSCHNHTLATGKPLVGHVTTTLDCGTCHTTITFATGSVSHDGYVNDCTRSGCHGNGASGKAGKHNAGLNTTNECQLCHKKYPARWAPAFTFDHSQIINSVCSSCHNGTIATGKGINHIPTSQECSYCHSVTDWGSTQFKRSPAKGVSIPNRNVSFHAK